VSPVNPVRWLLAGVMVAALGWAGLLAQERWGRRGDLMRTPTRIETNAAYDGQFTFVRLNYTTLPGGFWYRNQPAWSHGYPVAERNLMRILDALSTLAPKVDQVNSFSLEDQEIFRYPVLYIIEVGWWDMTDAEAVALRAYLDKGGFVIVDDFKMPGGIGGGGWDHFADNMARVLPGAEFIDLDASHPIFHSFFDIHSLEIVPQAYNAGRPVFRGLYEDNDTTKPLRMVVNYNTDISQFWEWSERGFRSVDDTNEAYKLGVNSILYGLTH
jgi:hypothetical protein